MVVLICTRENYLLNETVDMPSIALYYFYALLRSHLGSNILQWVNSRDGAALGTCLSVASRCSSSLSQRKSERDGGDRGGGGG